MWVWGSSILAVFLYRQFNSAGPALSVSQGAILGVVTGVIGALIGALVEAVFASSSLAGAFEMMRSQEALRPAVDTYLQMIKGGGYPIVGMLINLILYAGFGAVGGLIATALIWKAPPPNPINKFFASFARDIQTTAAASLGRDNGMGRRAISSNTLSFSACSVIPSGCTTAAAARRASSA